MRFVEGCDFQEFSGYLTRLGQYTGEGELDRLRRSLESGLFNLIVFREDGEIVGHAIWHETNTEEHRKGDPREKEDKEILEGFMGKGKDFIEPSRAVVNGGAQGERLWKAILRFL